MFVHEVLLTNVKEQITNTQTNMNETPKYYAEYMMSDFFKKKHGSINSKSWKNYSEKNQTSDWLECEVRGDLLQRLISKLSEVKEELCIFIGMMVM